MTSGGREVEADQLRRLIGELDGSREEAEALTGDLSPTQLRWRPEPEGWSVAECLDHLVCTGEAYLPKLDRALERARAEGLRAEGPFSRGFLGRWLVRGMEPPPGFRIPAPSAFRPSMPEDVSAETEPGAADGVGGGDGVGGEAGGSRDGSLPAPGEGERPGPLARFLEHQDRLARRVREADGLDLEAVKVPYPVLPLLRINLMAAFAYLTSHQRRHLWQARRVTEREGFPEIET